ncbi:MAG: potassium-transporting ATPase subunit KdpC [Rhizobium sp.]|nr:MAG: potassium-transporting ATPase subunit KdpC [Rhizobium sp.]
MEFNSTTTRGAALTNDPTHGPTGHSTLIDDLLKSLQPAIVLFLLLTLITGLAYPLAVTAIAQGVFPHAATGSLVRDHDRLVGSELVGQAFTEPRYFWGRPSASTPAYNGLGGSGSNVATTNPVLVETTKSRIERLHEVDPANTARIPIDLVTASASGLDPHISPAAANYQASRIARERGLTLDQVHTLIKQHTQLPTFGFLGQPRVNVLKLNISLDSLK